MVSPRRSREGVLGRERSSGLRARGGEPPRPLRLLGASLGSAALTRGVGGLANGSGRAGQWERAGWPMGAAWVATGRGWGWRLDAGSGDNWPRSSGYRQPARVPSHMFVGHVVTTWDAAAGSGVAVGLGECGVVGGARACAEGGAGERGAQAAGAAGLAGGAGGDVAAESVRAVAGGALTAARAAAGRLLRDAGSAAAVVSAHAVGVGGAAGRAAAASALEGSASAGGGAGGDAAPAAVAGGRGRELGGVGRA